MRHTPFLLAKSSSQVVQATTQFKPENTAMWAYNYFKTLQTHKNPILTREYKQLPDDSQFIEKHYNSLLHYRDLVCGVGGYYGDLPDITDLFLQLSKHVPQKKKGNPFYKTQLQQYNQFVTDLVATLRLNGGHLFVLDLLIYNQEVFNHVEGRGNKHLV